MAPTPAAPANPARPSPRFADADPDDGAAEGGGGGGGGSVLRALAFSLLGVGLLGVGFWAVKPKPGTRPPMAPPTAVATAMVTATSAPVPSSPAIASVGVVPPAPPAPAAVPPPAPPPAPPATATVAAGRLVGPPIDLRLTEGDTVHLALTADAPGELHLHGYDLARPTRPGVPVALDFPARRSGRFPLEWHGPHGSHVELGVIEVYPQ